RRLFALCRFLHMSLFLLRRLPICTLFPYTTLFRSHAQQVSSSWESRPLPSSARCWSRISCRAISASCSARTRCGVWRRWATSRRSEEHTSELQSRENLVCRLLLEKKKRSQTICRI